jgi:hypothetical protein
MAKLRLAERPTDETDPATPPSPTLAPDPASNSTSAKAALRRCNAAYQRAHKAFLHQEARHNPFAVVGAPVAAGKAYCDAMPMLVGEEGIRDFLACAAHGILIGAIKENKGSQLIYAAQVALSLLNLQCKQPRVPLAPPSRPAPAELPPPPSSENASKSEHLSEQALLNKYFAISSSLP